jgi:antitoxin component YwqK of YwqJK toxin-antitoxin module
MIMNKILITFFTILFCLTSSVGWSLTMDDLIEKNGIYYLKSTDVPFTGEIHEQNKYKRTTYGSFKDGQKSQWSIIWHNGSRIHGKYKNNLREGLWISYYPNGKISTYIDYENGKEEGPVEFFYSDGQKQADLTFKNGTRNGKCTYYNKDGTLMQDKTGTYKNGKKISD